MTPTGEESCNTPRACLESREVLGAEIDLEETEILEPHRKWGSRRVGCAKCLSIQCHSTQPEKTRQSRAESLPNPRVVYIVSAAYFIKSTLWVVSCELVQGS